MSMPIRGIKDVSGSWLGHVVMANDLVFGSRPCAQCQGIRRAAA